MLYWTWCWTLKNQPEIKSSVVYIRMLWWMCDNNNHDMSRNYNIKEHVKITPIISRKDGGNLV
jgi:hypothetical protein